MTSSFLNGSGTHHNQKIAQSEGKKGQNLTEKGRGASEDHPVFFSNVVSLEIAETYKTIVFNDKLAPFDLALLVPR